jgi:Spy/CpxP family protein refolding chaperone
MKKILALCMFLAVSIIVYAQKDSLKIKRTPEERAQQMTRAMGKRLSLSEEQQSKIYAIHLEHLKKIEDVKEKKVSGEKGSMRTVMDDLNAQVNAVLTDEQRKLLEEQKKERMAKMEERKAKALENKKQPEPQKFP